MHKVYLAGPIRGLNFEGATNWRDKAVDELEKHGITGYSPLRAKKHLLEHLDVLDERRNKVDHPIVSPQGVVGRDRFDVQTCDLMLVNLLDAMSVSIGTMFELAWADAWRKPVILVMENDGSNVHEHFFIRQTAMYAVEDLDEAIQLVAAVLLS